MRKSYIFLLPLLLFLALFVALPLLGTLITSMFEDTPFLEKRFLLWGNYKHLFLQSTFWSALHFTILFTAVSVPLEIFLGLLFALILNEKIPARGLLRACLLLPWAIPAAISARVWELIYDYHHGVANIVCMRLGLFDEPVNWLGTSIGAFFSIVLADVWKTTPFVAIILLGGLCSVPQHLYEQAKVDGANFFERFFHITLPLLQPALAVATLFRVIDALRVFDIVYVLTEGGPGGFTTSLSLYAYRHYLVGDFGTGAAISTLLFLIALSFSILYLRGRRLERLFHA
jgi:multiple sugar transport system permease protein